MEKLTIIKDFEDFLKTYDWYWEFADDFKYFKKGRQAYRKLQDFYDKLSPEQYRNIYNKYAPEKFKL